MDEWLYCDEGPGPVNQFLHSSNERMYSVIAQGCHVTTAVLERFKHESNTQAYLHDLENMHKVVLEVTISAHYQSVKRMI